ncbi:MAG TPA: orotate phosphoribosyltransferase [Dehalococcoidia bacterium]|nr:orotate phosphoribosyltransferase [Dehalococcoidia bacterium]
MIAAFEQAGAFLSGHFLLTSGRHSDRYMEKFNLLQWSDPTELVCRKMADAMREHQPVTVVGPTTGGVILSYEVARQLGLRGIIAEPNGEGGFVIQRGFRLESGERVLVVDDILTTGGSVVQTLDAVRAVGGEPVGVAVMADRTAGAMDFGVPFFAATDVEIQSYEADDCPLCRDGVELRDPKRA